MKLSLTKASVDALPHPDKGQVFYYDTKLPGFGVYTMKTCKTYFAEARVNGKTVRTVIGRHGVFYPDTARNEARELLVRMSKGENPNERANTSLTLGTMVSDYISERTKRQGKAIKTKTIDGYKWLLNTPLAPWKDKPKESLTTDLVRSIHKKITEERGPACANNTLRLLRATCNYFDVIPNPVEVLSKKRLWNVDKRRSNFIKSNRVSDWIEKAEDLNMIMRGAVLMMLFLGFRKMEALSLKKTQVRDGKVYLTDTKNGNDHMVPMGPYLQARIDALMQLPGPWLFPSASSETGHVMDPRKAIAALGEKVSSHDLRRTFVSHLNALEPAPSTYTIKRLMNHQQDSSDVTDGYIQIEEKKLREVITRLERSMVEKSSATE